MHDTNPDPTRLVRQQHAYGCGIASLAMITGQSYDDVREWLLANWPGGHERSDEWLEKRGTYSGIVEYYLGEHGYMWRYVYRAWYPDNWPPTPFAPVHLALVRQPSNNTHYVAMRADGVVLDPLTDEPRTLRDWPEVYNVAGVWRSPEDAS